MFSEEHRLIKKARNGNKPAFEQLYKKHVGRIYALCLRLGGKTDIAEDLVQEAFVNAWNNLAQFREDSAFSSWMYRIASNVAITYLRQKNRWDLVEFTEVHEQRIDSALSGEERDLDRAIKSLPDQARTVLILYEFLGYKHHEISEMTELAVGTCKAHLHRAKLLLKEKLNS